jgi:hypothetical protein
MPVCSFLFACCSLVYLYEYSFNGYGIKNWLLNEYIGYKGGTILYMAPPVCDKMYI